MKRFVSVLCISSMCYGSVLFASDCHVGFKINNGIFTQELKNSTTKELGLKDYSADQFDMNKLTFTARPVYDHKGNFRKCDLSNIRYADERFSGLGTAVKKGLVEAGLFTAGIATFYLTLLSLYYDDKSLENEKHAPVVGSYDHLDPYYHGPIDGRRGHRDHDPYYHHNYTCAYEYHRMREAEAGIDAATMLIVAAFEVPRNMRSTNFKGPAEDNLSLADCSVDAIKEKLVFDQYLYCGDFDGNISNKFSKKESEVRELVNDFATAVKKGKFEKARKKMTLKGAVNAGTDVKLALLRDRLAQESAEIHDVTALDGRSPFDQKQRLQAFIGNQRVEVLCEQNWAYQKNDLYAVGADFIPLNSYSKCSVDSL